MCVLVWTEMFVLVWMFSDSELKEINYISWAQPLCVSMCVRDSASKCMLMSVCVCV